MSTLSESEDCRITLGILWYCKPFEKAYLFLLSWAWPFFAFSPLQLKKSSKYDPAQVLHSWHAHRSALDNLHQRIRKDELFKLFFNSAQEELES